MSEQKSPTTQLLIATQRNVELLEKIAASTAAQSEHAKKTARKATVCASAVTWWFLLWFLGGIWSAISSLE